MYINLYYYSLNYIDLIAHMVNVIQQLNKRIEVLEVQQINCIKGENYGTETNHP